MNVRCPILKMPRPVAQAVGYAVHGLRFYHIPHPPLSRAKKGIQVGKDLCGRRQSVLGADSGTDGETFYDKWKWELKALEDNSFVAKVTSRIELHRAVTFGGVDARGDGVVEGVHIRFEPWQEKLQGYLLPKVWVRVFVVRPELRDFLTLWAILSTAIVAVSTSEVLLQTSDI
jgi:hypothetical protein